MASCARRFASAERRLAIRAVIRKLNNAIQFCGSAMVNLPIGGRKNRLKASVEATEAIRASAKPHVLAIASTTSR